VITNKGRAFKVDVLALPALPDASGTLSLRGAMPAREVAQFETGEVAVGIAPVTAPAGSPGVALGTRNGVVKVAAFDWPVRGDEFDIIGLKDGDEVVAAHWLPDEKRELVFVSTDSSLLHFPAANVRAQGRTGGGMAGINLAAGQQVAAFSAVDMAASDPVMVVTFTGHTAKVTPLGEYPAKGRATGGVRSHKFLKGEEVLLVAWVGSRPVASTDNGEPLELPDVDVRRDGSGKQSPNIAVVGHLSERG
jgi:DNA gyrase subunit A